MSEYKDNYRPGNGANNVGCIIMEVDTGNVLAMAGYPFFDLNEPRNAEAYLGKLLITLKLPNKEALECCNIIYDTDLNYQRIMRFGDENLKNYIKYLSYF